MRVDYQVSLSDWKSEWVCFEHEGFARQKAIAWWRRRSTEPVPATVEQAIELAEGGTLAPTLAITVRSVAGEPFERIVDYELGDVSEVVGVSDRRGWTDDADIPF
jgi:DNA repair protein RadD